MKPIICNASYDVILQAPFPKCKVLYKVRESDDNTIDYSLALEKYQSYRNLRLFEIYLTVINLSVCTYVRRRALELSQHQCNTNHLYYVITQYTGKGYLINIESTNNEKNIMLRNFEIADKKEMNINRVASAPIGRYPKEFMDNIHVSKLEEMEEINNSFVSKDGSINNETLRCYIL